MTCDSLKTQRAKDPPEQNLLTGLIIRPTLWDINQIKGSVVVRKGGVNASEKVDSTLQD